MRWNLGLPEAFKPNKKFRPILFLLILIDVVLTPILLPIIGYAFYRDQGKVQLYLLLKESFRIYFQFCFYLYGLLSIAIFLSETRDDPRDER